MLEATFKTLKDLMTTNGRIPRSTFWWYHLFLFATLLVLIISRSGLCIILLLIMSIIAGIKRWHDRNKSGWWFLIGLIPILGWLYVLIECGFLPGTQGENRFGPDPLL